jgi:hypothetical protein
MLNEPSCPGPRAAPARARDIRRVVTAIAVPLLVLAGSGTVAAQAFPLPQECSWGATGSEGNVPGQGDDPVVLVVRGPEAIPVTDFWTESSSATPPTWRIAISPFLGGTYYVVTTYTPFLTSDVLIDDLNRYPLYYVDLPPPGVTSGRKMGIYQRFTVTINDRQNKPLPNAYVDFIPAFVGASPLTLQANASGDVLLFCVQQVLTGYDITVYDSNHEYLYDGSFSTNATTAENLSGEAVSGGLTGRAQTRPHGQP